MLNKLVTLIVIAFALLLTGCQTPIVIPNVLTTKYIDKAVYLPVPSQYLEHCIINTKQIDKSAYINATDEAREVVWHDFAASLITDIKNCNVSIDALKQYNDAQVKLFSTGVMPVNKTAPVNTDKVQQ
jgi:hypothetical protein